MLEKENKSENMQIKVNQDKQEPVLVKEIEQKLDKQEFTLISITLDWKVQSQCSDQWK